MMERLIVLISFAFIVCECMLLNAFRIRSNRIARRWRSSEYVASRGDSDRVTLKAVPEWLSEDANSNDNVKQELVKVRFINTPSGNDVVATVEAGSNLLNVGDSVGVKLPRACRTGLCGSCTCELMDPNAVASGDNQRQGFAIIRACSSKCYAPDGMDEMVVDVGTIRQGSKKSSSSGSSGDNDLSSAYSDPMSRFSDNWEKDFRPSWDTSSKLTAASATSASMLGAVDSKNSRNVCKKCSGAGRIQCYTCDGVGRVEMGDGRPIQCSLCVGLCTVLCAYCKGGGITMKKSTSR